MGFPVLTGVPIDHFIFHLNSREFVEYFVTLVKWNVTFGRFVSIIFVL